MKIIYEKTNKTAEKLCKIIYFICAKVSIPGSVLPKALACFFIYFTTDLGNEAFELPMPLWLVYYMNNLFLFFVHLARLFKICLYLSMVNKLLCWHNWYTHTTHTTHTQGISQILRDGTESFEQFHYYIQMFCSFRWIYKFSIL